MSTLVEVRQKVLASNDAKAQDLRDLFRSKGICSINLMSSPGSGKTTMLERTIKDTSYKIGVIEGDLATNNDAKRAEAAGARAYQIMTGSTCHLDAKMVEDAVNNLDLQGLDLVFIENVGNLVCPASYDVGGFFNVVLLSVPEGDDKIAKYPVMFSKADLVLITKMNMVEHFNVDKKRLEDDLLSINPKAKLLFIDSITGDNFDSWLEILEQWKKSCV